MIGGETIRAKSRTFIPAKLADNAYLRDTNYAATLAALPEPYRSAYRDGNFQIAMQPDAVQVIPTLWIRMAQHRWTSRPPDGVPMCAIGVDVAQGGKDKTVLAIRHDGWFDRLRDKPGTETPSGSEVAGFVFGFRRDDCPVIVDVGGGYGSAAVMQLEANNVIVHRYLGSKAAQTRTKDRGLQFANVRTESYWRFREALDPEQPGGSSIALPDDPELVADLVAPRYFLRPNGRVQITPKEDLVEKIGRSPDKGDAVIMAWWQGTKMAHLAGGKWDNRRNIKVITRK
jgi:hypothetical protein